MILLPFVCNFSTQKHVTCGGREIELTVPLVNNSARITRMNSVELITKICDELFWDGFPTLYQCVQLNRMWCRIGIPFLWKYPFAYYEKFASQQLYSFRIHPKDTVLVRLLLYFSYGCPFLLPKRPLFEYPKYLKYLDFDILKQVVLLGVSAITREEFSSPFFGELYNSITADPNLFTNVIHALERYNVRLIGAKLESIMLVTDRNVILRSPMLRQIRFLDIYIPGFENQDFSWINLLAPTLRELHVCYNNLDKNYEWIENLGSKLQYMSKLHTFGMYVYDKNTFSLLINELNKHVAQSLRYLYIHGWSKRKVGRCHLKILPHQFPLTVYLIKCKMSISPYEARKLLSRKENRRNELIVKTSSMNFPKQEFS
ncbi:uncharacterized protein OCT59_002908 [Rhizophagus irregularis]|nr:hypothetical protein OCT59_002908 [Rhizophagus irregularis]GET63526.1 hypothetical protein GLOIN_2v1811197 [Rhizophagus irregularis DAOM 181602=DAOM 197198]